MKKNYLLALLSGIILGISWPTYGVPLFLFVGFVPLLLAERQVRLQHQKKTKRKVFLLAYLAFVTWNSITTWWLWYSTAFGMFFAILVNSLLMALVFLLYHVVAKRLPEKWHLWFLPAVWIAFEKFHLNWDFSWPWLNLGNAFSNHPTWVQWYQYTGVFGGSLWVWLVNIWVFKSMVLYKEHQNRRVLSIAIAKNMLVVALPIIVSMLMYNRYKPSEENIEVLLLQPNVNPYSEKYNQTNEAVARGLVEMASKGITPETAYVIAPETVLAKGSSIDNFPYSTEKQLLQSLSIEHPNLNVIAGADFYRLYLQPNKPSKYANPTSRGDWFDAYNAAVQLNRTDSIQYYIKSKLVVGVEFFPMKNILEPLLGNVMLDLGGTVATRAMQDERAVFTSENRRYKAAPIVCYESVYGEYVTGYVKKGANFLAIITNDAWWNNTQGHKQHLSYAKLRAIETRRSIARSANTGISAFINERGDVVSQLAYGKKGILKGHVSINESQTFYVRFGDYIARIAVLMAAVLFLYAFARKRVKI